MVTLAGHGSGAACINFLMTSPTMVPGLFHRAILLSGSAFSSWALVDDPVVYALKLAKEVNCSIPEDLIKNHEELVDCLRNAPLEDLYAADIQSPSFLTAFGPSVRSGHWEIVVGIFHLNQFSNRLMVLSFELDYLTKIRTNHRFVANRNDHKMLLVVTIYCLVWSLVRHCGDSALTIYRTDLRENGEIESYAHMCVTPIRII